MHRSLLFSMAIEDLPFRWQFSQGLCRSYSQWLERQPGIVCVMCNLDLSKKTEPASVVSSGRRCLVRYHFVPLFLLLFLLLLVLLLVLLLLSSFISLLFSPSFLMFLSHHFFSSISFLLFCLSSFFFLLSFFLSFFLSFLSASP